MTTFRLPILRWFTFTRAGLRADLVAGLLLGLVAVPPCPAYATLAGMPPHYGLWAAILPCAVSDLTARLGLRSIPDLPSGPCPAIRTRINHPFSASVAGPGCRWLGGRRA